MRITIDGKNFDFIQVKKASVNMVVGTAVGEWLKINVKIEDTLSEALVDNGSSISFITAQMADKLGLTPRSRTSLKIKTINDKKSMLTNIFEVQIKVIKSQTYAYLRLHEVPELPDGYHLMLGKDAIRSMNAKIQLKIDKNNESNQESHHENCIKKKEEDKENVK